MGSMGPSTVSCDLVRFHWQLAGEPDITTNGVTMGFLSRQVARLVVGVILTIAFIGLCYWGESNRWGPQDELDVVTIKLRALGLDEIGRSVDGAVAVRTYRGTSGGYRFDAMARSREGEAFWLDTLTVTVFPVDTGEHGDLTPAALTQAEPGVRSLSNMSTSFSGVALGSINSSRLNWVRLGASLQRWPGLGQGSARLRTAGESESYPCRRTAKPRHDGHRARRPPGR